MSENYSLSTDSQSSASATTRKKGHVVIGQGADRATYLFSIPANDAKEALSAAQEEWGDTVIVLYVGKGRLGDNELA